MKSSYWFSIIASLVLSGCDPIYKTEFTYQLPHSDLGKMCAAQCIQTQNNCQQTCEIRKQTCEINANQEAMIKYLNYKEIQTAAGKPIEKTPEDFNFSFCDQSCDCTDIYNRCYQTCGGTVMPHQVCTAFCK